MSDKNANNNNSNLLTFILLSTLIWMGFQYFYVKPLEERYRAQHPAAPPTAAPANPSAPNETLAAPRDRAAALKETPRVPVKTPSLAGSINLRGARFDDISFVRYRESVAPGAPQVTLLSPSSSAPPLNAYYAELGWLAGDASVPVPTSDTVWKTADRELTAKHPLHLVWNNGKGLTFERTVAVDDSYMFTVTDSVVNAGNNPVTLYPFGLVSRQGDYFIERRALPEDERKKYAPSVYEGPLGVLDGTLEEVSYKKLLENGKTSFDSAGGWVGMSDRYWLVAMVPPQDEAISAQFLGSAAQDKDNPDTSHYQADFRGAATALAPGARAEHVMRVYVGAKDLDTLEAYGDKFGIKLFNRAIDFGWYWFLTIPFLKLLNYFGHTLGSFGLAIIMMTILIRCATMPLSIKMYRSSARMRELAPELQRIKERFPEDKVRQSQEQMELFKREKINPLAGCMPLLIQLPIFFALYKTLMVSIELRQAPFYGWVRDMSVEDPTSFFTLFGLVPWDAPLHIGAWPVMMGISMWVQQKLSPQPPDPTQARMFMVMPVVLTYVMAHLPVGLVIYYTCSNVLSIAQQWYIMNRVARRHGTQPAAS